MKRNILVICIEMLMVSLFFSCLSFNPSSDIMMFGQTASEDAQTFEGTQTTETLVIVPPGPALKDDDDMGLKIGRVSLNGNIQKYIFQAEVHTQKDFLLLDSMSVRLDDGAYVLKDDDPYRKNLWSGYYLEVLTFDISPELLEEMKTSKMFSVELYKRIVTLDEKQLQTLKDFL
jgi:hypothetical protein